MQVWTDCVKPLTVGWSLSFIFSGNVMHHRNLVQVMIINKKQQDYPSKILLEIDTL